MAVKDHEHFRLKLLFTQKKKIEHENKQIRADRDNYKVRQRERKIILGSEIKLVQHKPYRAFYLTAIN